MALWRTKNPTAARENDDGRDPNPLDDIVAEADERAAILEFEGGLPKADAERMAERQFGLEPGALANGGRDHDDAYVRLERRSLTP